MALGAEIATEPVDVVVDRLNDPRVAAALVSILDNAELLALVVGGLDGLLRRGDEITESLVAGIDELRDAERGVPGMPRADELASAAARLGRLALSVSESTSGLTALIESDMFEPGVIALLSTVADAIVEGDARARERETSVKGVFGALRAMKDPDVQRGLGYLVEVAGALGRKLQSQQPAAAQQP